MSEEEEEELLNWVRMYAADFLRETSPGRFDDAPMSKAVRFRWFNLKLRGRNYQVGLNIHYGGNFGAMWIKNKSSGQTLELHPNKSPRHDLPTSLYNALKDYLRSENYELSQKI